MSQVTIRRPFGELDLIFVTTSGQTANLAIMFDLTPRPIVVLAAFMWWSSFIRLLQRAWGLSLDYMGVTAVGLALGLCYFLIMECYIGFTEGREAVKRHFRGSAGVGILLTVVVWLGLFLFCMAKEVYDDHVSLVTANSKKGEIIQQKDQQISDQAKAIQDLEKKLKEQPKVISKESSKGSPPAMPTINTLLVEARTVCTLRDPLKMPHNMSNVFFREPPVSFLEGPTGKAHLRPIIDVRFQRMEEEGKASAILRYDLPNNSDLIGEPTSSLARYKQIQVTLWAIHYDSFTECSFLEMTLRVNGADVFRRVVTDRWELLPNRSKWIRLPLEGIKTLQ